VRVQVYYDKKSHTMTALDPARPDDFISISGSKMRQLAAQGATQCSATAPLPSDLLKANCIPPGFMVQAGWDIVCDYYQHVHDKVWVPYSKSDAPSVPPLAPHTSAMGVFGTLDFRLYVHDAASKAVISPWHDVPLLADSSGKLYNMVVEIPRGYTAKLEIQKQLGANPIAQDTFDSGAPRYFTYGVPFFNYGAHPQTWEDPGVISATGRGGDNDPLDVMEIGDTPLAVGTVVAVKVLGSLELIDQGETDHKIIALRASDPLAKRVHTVADFERERPGTLANLVDWLINYKTTDGKPQNTLAQPEPTTVEQAVAIIEATNKQWQALRAGTAKHDAGFCLKKSSSDAHCSYPQ
jgi:3'-phosphoadenosine 5'-phosphosulfate synthase